MTGHHPDLAMPPLRLGQRTLGDQGPSSLSGRLRPPALRRLSPPRFGLPPAPGPFGHANQSAGLHADHFKALEGPRRPSTLLLPHPNLNHSLTQHLSQPSDLDLQLLLPRRGLTRLNPSSAAFKELPFPVPDHLPGNPLPADCLNNRDLTFQHGQHDTELLLHRDHHRTTQNNSDLSARALHQQLTTPAHSLTRDTPTVAALERTTFSKYHLVTITKQQGRGWFVRHVPLPHQIVKLFKRHTTRAVSQSRPSG